MIAKILDFVQESINEAHQKIQAFKNEAFEKHAKGLGVAISEYLVFHEGVGTEHIFYVANNKAYYGFTLETTIKTCVDLFVKCEMLVIPFGNVFIETLTKQANEYVRTKQ